MSTGVLLIGALFAVPMIVAALGSMLSDGGLPKHRREKK